MKFGVVLPTWVYSRARQSWADAAFRDLVRTRIPSETPHLLLLLGPSDYKYPIDELGKVFHCAAFPQPENVAGTEQTLAWGTQYIFDNFPDITHAVWMGDDAAFHSDWLIELEALIQRHPEARSWSVYRSAHTTYHATIREEGTDVLVKSICGHGMTFSREEWAAWGIDWRHGKMWVCPTGGETLDLHHPWARPGERWVTRQSYVDHTGRTGFHCQPHIPEWAQNFLS